LLERSIEILLKPLITHVGADRLQSALVEFRPELLRRHSCGAGGLHLRDPIALCDIERFHRVLHEGTPKAPELESQLFLQWFLFGGRDCINCEHGDECDYDAWVHWEGGVFGEPTGVGMLQRASDENWQDRDSQSSAA